MKQVKQILIIAIVTVFFWSCGSSVTKQAATADGFADIEQELKNEFGDEAYYTELTIMYSESIGNSISTTVTDAPESLKMGQWTYAMGKWTQTSEISLEIPEGTKAADFMFQLDENINLSKLGGLVEKSTEQLTKEKKIENPRFEMAFVKYPKDGNMDNAQYIVKLEPENGGTSFTFSYSIDGSFIEMDY